MKGQAEKFSAPNYGFSFLEGESCSETWEFSLECENIFLKRENSLQSRSQMQISSAHVLIINSIWFCIEHEDICKKGRIPKTNAAGKLFLLFYENLIKFKLES